jgi:hypothetical protein
VNSLCWPNRTIVALLWRREKLGKSVRNILIVSILIIIGLSSASMAQDAEYNRLPADILDAAPPSDYVSGLPGNLSGNGHVCRSLPVADVRRRIVDIAVQEWSVFGFPIVDRSNVARRFFPDGIVSEAANPEFAEPQIVRAFPRLGTFEDSERVATAIAGYWAATPEGAPILDEQNQAWNGPGGDDVTWLRPWSAAFISWVMCEAGLGESSQFSRSVAHHRYIDQAIRARDGEAPESAFVAYDPGEQEVSPGDLLCNGRASLNYRTIADRRRNLGQGARTHCDIVVKVDEAASRILVIGGNVFRSLSLTMLPAMKDEGGPLKPSDDTRVAGTRNVFAHLKLRAPPIEADALDHTPTIRSIYCVVQFDDDGEGTPRFANTTAEC